MAKAYSADLRKRVIGAIEEGMSTRAAARRYSIGGSTAGAWHRRWRDEGDGQARKQGHANKGTQTRARKQGQPSGSKLDPHEAFILGLVDAQKDIALYEIAARLEEEKGVQACPATIWYFFDRRGITYKKRPPTPQSKNAMM